MLSSLAVFLSVFFFLANRCIKLSRKSVLQPLQEAIKFFDGQYFGQVQLLLQRTVTVFLFLKTDLVLGNSNSLQPDRSIHGFRASKSADWNF